MKVLLAGGGTGGHVNPALAIADIIKAHDPGAEFLFAGTPNHMESKLVPQMPRRCGILPAPVREPSRSSGNLHRTSPSERAAMWQDPSSAWRRKWASPPPSMSRTPSPA